MSPWPAIIGTLIPLAVIIGGIAVIITSILARSQVRQLEIRERIALIERGHVPPPEVDPGGFDRAMGRLDHHRRSRGRGRHRRAGILLIGTGLGLTVLIAFTSRLGVALGVGGFLTLLGLSFLVASSLEPSEPTGPAVMASPASPPDLHSPDGSSQAES